MPPTGNWHFFQFQLATGVIRRKLALLCASGNWQLVTGVLVNHPKALGRLTTTRQLLVYLENFNSPVSNFLRLLFLYTAPRASGTVKFDQMIDATSALLHITDFPPSQLCGAHKHLGKSIIHTYNQFHTQHKHKGFYLSRRRKYKQFLLVDHR